MMWLKTQKNVLVNLEQILTVEVAAGKDSNFGLVAYPVRQGAGQIVIFQGSKPDCEKIFRVIEIFMASSLGPISTEAILRSETP